MANSVVAGDQKRREEIERLEKEKQAEIRSYNRLMVQEKMTSNKDIAAKGKSLAELEEDFMWHLFFLKISNCLYHHAASLVSVANGMLFSCVIDLMQLAFEFGVPFVYTAWLHRLEH